MKIDEQLDKMSTRVKEGALIFLVKRWMKDKKRESWLVFTTKVSRAFGIPKEELKRARDSIDKFEKQKNEKEHKTGAGAD